MWSAAPVIARAAAAVEVVGVVERLHRVGSRQVASTRVCATSGSIGVPVGTHVDWLDQRRHRRAAGQHAHRAHHELPGDAGRRRTCR